MIRKYSKVPPHLHDHDVLPNVSDIPSILTTMRRRRAVSVGPQSEADAYETLAYREKRKRENLSSEAITNAGSTSSGHTSAPFHGISKLEEYEHMMGTGNAHVPTMEATSSSDADVDPRRSPEYEPEESSPAEVFARIQKPRVRYDVEVVTRLIVYSGESLSGIHSMRRK